MAPPRRPNHLKILQGERESRINRNAPLPGEATIVAPVELSDGAQKIWNRLAPDLIDKGCLTSWDVDQFVIFCDAAATYYNCRAALGSDYTVKGSVKDTTVKSPLWRIMRDCADTMRVVGGKFGLNRPIAPAWTRRTRHPSTTPSGSCRDRVTRHPRL
jgi:P27 family predicted phage terminase small subunit